MINSDDHNDYYDDGGGVGGIMSNGSNYKDYKGRLVFTLNHCTHLTLWVTPP